MTLNPRSVPAASRRFFVLAFALLLACTSALRAAAQTVVYINANVYTAADGAPRAEAFATKDDVFLAVGSEASVRKLTGRVDRVVDLRGRTVLPGFIDAHGHLEGLGALTTGSIDLADTRSYDEVVARVRRRASEVPDGTWIVGRGWDHEFWRSKELPNHTKLSEAVPNHPVWLGRVDGHAALGNMAAMRIAGVRRGTVSPPGGEVLLDATGEPTGVFVDNAESLVARHVPPSAYGESEAKILGAQEQLLSLGITGMHDMGTPVTSIPLLRRLEAEGRLKLRVQGVVPASEALAYFSQNEPFTGDRFGVRATKLYMDGAMGSRGAWLLEPYEDRRATQDGNPYTGLALMATEDVERIATRALERGFQVCTHAIGDRANREVLDAYERAAAAAGVSLDGARFRVEHVQMLHPADIPRFADLGVIPSMQAKHCTSDLRWVEARIGTERAAGTYAWASLLRTGARLANGSDFPVEPANPFLGFYATVTRQDDSGYPADGWFPAERLTRAEALKSFTVWAAAASFDEERLGSIETGKQADFIVVDRDIMTVDPQAILGTSVHLTVIAGEAVYEVLATSESNR
ncbi:MAG: amidohydrolase [Planctomycetota bacterium]